MMCQNVPNWQIFFQEDKRAHVNWRLKQGKLQWLAIFIVNVMHLANAFIQSDLHWNIFFIQFSFFLLIVCFN